MVTLKETERDIISLAQLDADTPVAQIAKQLNLKEHTVRYTLSKLEDSGVIRRLLYVNLYRVGFVEYQLFLRLANNTPAEEKKLVDTLLTSERVSWLVRLGGTYSLGLAFMAQSTADCVSFINGIIERSGVQLSDRAFSVLASRSYFGVKHLSHQPIERRMVDMGTVGSALVDWEELDHEILKLLSDSKMSSSAAIARSLGKPESTVQYRLKTLRERDILCRTVYLVDPDSYGMSAFRLRAVVSAPTRALRDKLHAWAFNHPNVLSCLHCLGPWDFEFRVEVRDPKSAITVAQSLAEVGGAAVASTEIVPTLETIRLLHYPFKKWPVKRDFF